MGTYRITTASGRTFTVRYRPEEAAAHIAAGRVVEVVE